MIVMLLLGCGDPAADTGACQRSPPLRYDNFGAGFLSTHCTGCHSSLLPLEQREGAPEGVDLNTYADVLMWADRIEARALAQTPDMPPGGGPGAEELALLAEWLRCEVYPDAAALEER